MRRSAGLFFSARPSHLLRDGTGAERALTSNDIPARSGVADVIVSGAGSAGLAAAVALAKNGFAVVCAGPIDDTPTGRTVALFEGSLQFLRQLGVWSRFAADAQPIKAIRMIDDTGPVPTGARLDPGSRRDRPRRSGFERRGWSARPWSGRRGGDAPNLTLTGSLLESISFDENGVRVVGADGRSFVGRLMVAADGRRSPARVAAGIAARTWRYSQVALTAFVSHRRPHESFSTEFHTRAGPCTLVPLKGTQPPRTDPRLSG